MRKALVVAAVTTAVAAIIVFLQVSRALAHCDTMDGPVVAAAREALDTGDLNYVLPWVSAKDEPEIRAAFGQTRTVRTLGPEARELADRYFFETLVRVHRAGEGAPYTGLQPAGTEVNPAVGATDRAFASGSADALVALLTQQVKEGVTSRFAEAKAAQSKGVGAVQARRRGVHAYVEFVHYAEGIYNAAAGAAAEGEAAHGQAEPRETAR